MVKPIQTGAAVDEWLSECCDAPPVGDLVRWMDVRKNRECAEGYCKDCGEKTRFRKKGDER